MSLIPGCDTNQPLTHFAKRLHEKGKRFAGRYLRRLAHDRSCLTKNEIEALHKAGLAILPVFQHRSNKVEEFNTDNAYRDADATLARCEELGIPQWVTIYLAFDTDFSKSNVHVAVTYGEIWARALKGDGYGTGCYGDREVLETLTETNREGWGDLFDHRWAAGAVGWGLARDYDVFQSSLPYEILPGLYIDDCVAHSFERAGMWTVK